MDRPAVLAALGGLMLAPLVALAASRVPTYAAAGTAALIVGLVLFRWPRLGAYALVALFPFNTVWIKAGSIYLGPGDALEVAFLPVWILYRLAHPQGLRLPRYWPMVLAYLGLCFVSMMLGVHPARAYGTYTRVFAAALSMIAIIDLGGDRDFLQKALWLVAIGGVVHCLAALPEIGRQGRVEGLVHQPNLLGHIVGTCLMAALGLYEMETKRWRRTALLGAVALMLLICALTISRGTYAALGVAFVWWAWRSRAQLTIAVVAIAAVAFATEGTNRGHVQQMEQRLQFEDGHSADNRVATAQNGLRAIGTHPVLGVGFGQFRELDQAMDVTSQYDRSAHSFYLNVAASSGLPALATLLAFIGIMVRRLWRRRAEAEALGPDERQTAQLLRTFQGLVVFSAVSLITKDEGTLRFWALLALLYGGSVLLLPRKREVQERLVN
jgi:O-antigen ligase